MQLVTTVSYRFSINFLNRVLHRQGDLKFKLKTISDHTVSRGTVLSALKDAVADKVLAGRSADGPLVETSCIFASGESQHKLEAAANAFNVGKEPHRQIKLTWAARIEADHKTCVIVSIDDVGVKHQKDTRKDGGTKNGKRVENTVIHVEHDGHRRILTAVGMERALRQLAAYLIANGLEGRSIVFFSDGASNIRTAVAKYFGENAVLLLDWYHLDLHAYQAISQMARGRKDKKEQIRYEICSRLWAGNVDEAIAYVEGMDKSQVKDEEKRTDFIDYLRRKKPYVTCYALRKEEEYRNSSNPAEKANDLVVSQREKHNGMSWSFAGSGALASLKAAVLNDELYEFLTTDSISYRLQAA